MGHRWPTVLPIERIISEPREHHCTRWANHFRVPLCIEKRIRVRAVNTSVVNARTDRFQILAKGNGNAVEIFVLVR